jgi:hypothetical protein
LPLLALITLADAAQAATRWRYQSIWRLITLWRGDKYFGDLLNQMAAPDLAISISTGHLVTKSDEMFDAVAKGTIQMGTDWPSYWEGKNTAFSLITRRRCGSRQSITCSGSGRPAGWSCARTLRQIRPGLVSPLVTGPESGQRSNKRSTRGRLQGGKIAAVAAARSQHP